MTSQWARWRLKSPAPRLFTQPFIQAQTKENIKAPCHWPLCGEFTDDRWIPRAKASNAENVSIWWRHYWCIDVKWTLVLGFISLTFFSIAIQIRWRFSFCSHFDSYTVFATKCCPQYDSCVVVICAKYTYDLMANKWITWRRNFWWIWNTCK